MNVFFSAMAMVAGTVIGLYYSKKLRERERIISAVILLIKDITVQIKYTNSEIGAILKSAASNEAYKILLFVTACNSLDEKGDFHKFWNEGVKNQPYINSRDKELLLSVGNKLGSTDMEGQLSFLEMSEEILKAEQERAFSDYMNKGKVYRSVGMLCGLAAGIILL